MRTATLTRQPSTPQGTFGEFISDRGFKCVTGELPEKNNIQQKSCIPVGTYICKYQYSPLHGKNVYHLIGVPGRNDIEIHSGNWCGDIDLGFESDVLGCIIVGEKISSLTPPKMVPQSAVTNSILTLGKLEDEFNKQDFQLTIRNC